MNAPAHTAVNPTMGEPHPRKPLKSIDIALGSHATLAAWVVASRPWNRPNSPSNIIPRRDYTY